MHPEARRQGSPIYWPISRAMGHLCPSLAFAYLDNLPPKFKIGFNEINAVSDLVVEAKRYANISPVVSRWTPRILTRP